MDTRRLITAMLAAFAVFYLWIYISPHFFPPPPPVETPAEEWPVPTTRPATLPSTSTSAMEIASAPASAPDAITVQIDGGDSTAPLRMGDASDGSFYPMALELLPRGASVSKAFVRGYYDSLTNKEPYPLLMPVIAEGGYAESGDLTSFITSRVLIENRELAFDLDKVIWKVEEAD
ncbi:MAG: hypothetical protein GXY44_15365, partial [Phycisphaerales bacterium]|nr:hypothetical protein [Phycisphaerales bacterium]